MSELQILIVDDHPLFRAGLAHALRGEPDLRVLAEAAAPEDVLTVARATAIDVAILDVLMPGMSGISLTCELRELQPRCAILGLSVIDEPGLIADMLLAGASGFAFKTQPIEDIIAAVRCVAGGVRYLPPRVSHDAIERELTSTPDRPLRALTRREREVFELVIRGHSNDAIATRLSIARRTVETHRLRVTHKLSARSIAEMMRAAAVHGGLS